MAKAKKDSKKEVKEMSIGDRKGFTKMFSPRTLTPGFPQMMFGHEAVTMENGHTIVFVPEKIVANESKRGNALMTKKVYDALYPAEDTAEEE